MKRIRFLSAALLLAALLAPPARADFEPETDYSVEMIRAAAAGDHEAGREAAARRAEKIAALALDEAQIDYDELLLLARLIHTEAGSAWLPETWRMAVGEVALNRVASPEFPDTLAEVVFQPGQYAAADEGYFAALTPYLWCAESACRLLRGERVLHEPAVVFQSGHVQGGGVFLELCDSYYGSTFLCLSSRPELY